MAKDDSTYTTMTQVHSILGNALTNMNGIAVTLDEEERLRSLHMDIAAAHELSGHALGPYRVQGGWQWALGLSMWALGLYGAVDLIRRAGPVVRELGWQCVWWREARDEQGD